MTLRLPGRIRRRAGSRAGHESAAGAAFSATVRMIRGLQALLERIGPDRLAGLAAADGNTPEVFEFLGAQLFGE